MASLHIPAASGAVTVTRSDGSTKTYKAGRAVEIEDRDLAVVHSATAGAGADVEPGDVKQSVPAPRVNRRKASRKDTPASPATQVADGDVKEVSA